jgi:uncharacterized protein YutE (UPF0331/DUF86 family)
VSPVQVEVIRRKLSVIVNNLKALEPFDNINADDYAADLYRRKAVERLLQELIEAAIDINTHIIVETGGLVPDNYFDTFLRMGELGALSMVLARAIAPSAGLRNRLVHQYDELDDSIILKAVGLAQDHYARYVKEIGTYLER